MKQFRYNNIFLYASLQFCGNIEEYFSHNTKKLLVFIVMPRLRNKFNLLRIYQDSTLIREKKIWSSENIILYYASWYVSYLYFIFTYYARHEAVTIISSHPISFFGMSIQKIFRNITFVYFIGDYFPGTSVALRMFENLKKHYHDRITYATYLSDGINRKLNGRVVKSNYRKTIMWGIKTLRKAKKNIGRNDKFTLLFVGLIKESQGLEFLFTFLKNNKEYAASIIGICDESLYKKYKSRIKEHKIEKQIFFPNKFYSNEELIKIAESCHVGVALYDLGENNATFYTDPGKVKSYAEMGLPVIMTDTSGVAPYVKKFKSGIVINENLEALESAVLAIKKDYKQYVEGLQKFINYFYFEAYYTERYKFLEQL